MFQVGMGLYSLSDAAKLIGAQRRDLKRWLFGYEYQRASSRGAKRYRSEPLWPTAFAEHPDRDLTIGFADLLEARIVNEFVKHGVHLIVVRRCLERARQILKSDYPFTHSRFSTDGRTIYAEALADVHREHELLDLRSSQFAFKEVIKPSLYAGIEYRDGHAMRWYPMSRSRAVLVDPRVQFGRPVLADVNVPTSAIHAAYFAEGKRRAAVARMFEISPAEVDAAIRFELSLSREVSH